MTPGKQKLTILILFLVFISVIPVIICYSMGYRISDDFKIVETGGIYLSISESDTTLYINDKLTKKAGLIGRNILVQNLKPGTYSIRLEKENYWYWRKNIKVQERQVEICYPLLVPEKFKPVEIKKYIPADKKPAKEKKKKYIINDEYKEAAELFKKPVKPGPGLLSRWYKNKPEKIKTGKNIKLKNNVLLVKKGNRIYAKWLGKEEQLPFFINTMEEKPVFSSRSIINSFDFYPGREDSILVRFSNGSLYAVEIDTRFTTQNSYRILRYCKNFIVDQTMLYYFRGSRLYSLDFD
jgi:hypothetical protein